MEMDKLLALLLIFCLLEKTTGDPISQLPECGLKCIAHAVPESSCKTLTNVTCICNDKPLRHVIEACIFSSCNKTDALIVAGVQANACALPVRSRKSDLLATLSIEIPAFFAVILRLYSRWYTSSKFEMDDWIMLLVAILYLVFFILGQYVGILCFGVDVWTVPIDTITFALKLFYVDESFYLAILALTKISILCFYLRIFPNRGFHRVTYVVIGWVAAAGIIFLFMQIFQCVPLSYSWEGWMGAGAFGDANHEHCLDVNTLTYTAAAFSIAQDLVILILPIPLLLKLNTSRRRKAGILVMFSLGIFVLITSCVRLRFIVRFARSTNPTWDYTDSLIWSGLEVAVSIIVTSLPAIRVLLNRVLPRMWLFATTTTHRSTEGQSGGRAPEGLRINASPQPAGMPERRPVRSVQSRLFSIMAGSQSSLNESELELGDHPKSDAGPSRHMMSRPGRAQASDDDAGEGSALSRRDPRQGGNSRIEVRTTTTVQDMPNDQRQHLRS